MIEPPKTIAECQDVITTFQALISVDSSDVYTVARKLAEILNEREALRALANELAASNCMTMNEEDTEYCIFCGRFKWSGHEENCLVERAKGLVK